jgi:YegS/Rv2252/BmrU family lipid kinase
MKASVLLNAAAGSVDSKETAEAVHRVLAAFQAAGAEAVVCAVEPAGLPAAVERGARSDVDAVVLAGGDGTLNSGVAVLVAAEQPKPLGILPLGTLNHFAKDLGIPMDLEGAVGAVAAGHVRTVDLGEVNGRVFLNNSSIGIYPEVVREREEIQDRGMASKWLATLRAAIDQLRRFPMVTVTLRLPDRTLRVTSPLIFVGNNRYEMKLLRIGRRPHLDRGELFLYVARDRSRLGFVALALRALFGRLDAEKDFVSVGLQGLEVATSWRRSLRVALDGEVMRLATPLRYRVRPRALRVLAPPETA